MSKHEVGSMEVLRFARPSGELNRIEIRLGVVNGDEGKEMHDFMLTARAAKLVVSDNHGMETLWKRDDEVARQAVLVVDRSLSWRDHPSAARVHWVNVYSGAMFRDLASIWRQTGVLTDLVTDYVWAGPLQVEDTELDDPIRRLEEASQHRVWFGDGSDLICRVLAWHEAGIVVMLEREPAFVPYTSFRLVEAIDTGH